MNTINIDNSFEGANPFHEDRIKKRGRNYYVVIPFCEDNTNNYKFRLDIKLIHNGKKGQWVDLNIDWQDDEFNCYRDILYIKNGKSPWEPKRALTKNGRSLLKFELMPGVTYVGLSPKYSLEDLSAFMTQIPNGGFINKRIVGNTNKGKDIWLVSTVANRKNATKLLFSARVHPYETAPSYIVEGLIEFLSKPQAKSFVDTYDIYILPMVCPDGVADGCCRLSSLENGVDFARELDLNHDLTRTYLSIIDDIKPNLYVELHNWMLKQVDGMFYLNGFQAIKLLWGLKTNMPRYLQKNWEVGCRYKVFARKPYGLKQYCKEKHGAKVLTLEFPWYQRNIDVMRQIGSIILPSIEKIV